MRYRYILFDLDGTLTDSGEGIFNSALYAFEKLGLPAPDRQTLRKMVGPPLSVGFPLAGVPDELVGEAIRFYRDRYNNRGGMYENRVYDGIEPLLNALGTAGFRLCVATSKPETVSVKILSEFRLLPYFAFVAGAAPDSGRESKEDVLKYLLSVLPKEGGAVMVGDTHYDVTGAHRLGLPCIGVTWGYGRKEELIKAGADAIVGSPEQLLRVLLQEP